MDMKNQPQPPQENASAKKVGKSVGGNYWSAFGLALELGWSIAIPLVIFAMAGRFADKVLGTTPWLFLVGLLVSIAISVYLIHRKVKNILNNP